MQPRRTRDRRLTSHRAHGVARRRLVRPKGCAGPFRCVDWCADWDASARVGGDISAPQHGVSAHRGAYAAKTALSAWSKAAAVAKRGCRGGAPDRLLPCGAGGCSHAGSAWADQLDCVAPRDRRARAAGLHPAHGKLQQQASTPCSWQARAGGLHPLAAHGNSAPPLPSPPVRQPRRRRSA